MRTDDLHSGLQDLQKAINRWFDRNRATLKELMDMLVNNGDHPTIRYIKVLDADVGSYYEKRSTANKLKMMRTLEWFRKAKILLIRDPLYGPINVLVGGKPVLEE